MRRGIRGPRRGPGGRSAPEQPAHPNYLRSQVASHGVNRTPWILGALAAVAGSFTVGYAAAVFLLFPAPADAGDAVPVPDLIGQPISDAERVLTTHGLVLADVADLPHAGELTGIVLAQAPLPGQFLHAGAGVRLAVSAGVPRSIIPSVTGLAAREAEALLARIGFVVARRERPAPQPAGRVLRVEPRAGTEQELQTRVTLIVSSGPPPDVVPEGIIRYTDPVLIPPIRDTLPARREP